MSFLTWLKLQWDRVVAVVAVTAGLVALIAAWVRASGTVELAHHVPYLISGGLGGVFLLGVGATLWLSADMRDEWGELHRLDARLARLEGEVPPDGIGEVVLSPTVGLVADVRAPAASRVR